MFYQFLNWRSLLMVVALVIIAGTVYYSGYLARKIANEEKQKVEQWVEASRALLTTTTNDVRLPFKIITDNKDIPIIETNEKDSITNFVNLDSLKVAGDPAYLSKRLASLKKINAPIIYVDPFDSTKVNRYYFGHTSLLNEVQYYPLIQLLIGGLFILITILALRSNYRSTQNQLWAGMAKETAHQLGTPVSSLEGWLEMLREKPGNETIVQELEKDVNRLRLVSDRFGKIGSTPHLSPTDVVLEVNRMVDYIRRRSPGNVKFSVGTHDHLEVPVLLSAPLFDWVIENLLKNALDAMDGKGSIYVDIKEEKKNVIIDVTDTGKGMSGTVAANVFKPGFTTKKRGWGLGLSLSKRVIETYHNGEIFVKSSEPGKGTTFRIVLKK